MNESSQKVHVDDDEKTSGKSQLGERNTNPEKEVREWIEDVLAEAINGSLHDALKTGEIVCKVIDTYSVNEFIKIETITCENFDACKKCKDVAIRNFNNANKAAVALGIKDSCNIDDFFSSLTHAKEKAYSVLLKWKKHLDPDEQDSTGSAESITLKQLKYVYKGGKYVLNTQMRMNDKIETLIGFIRKDLNMGDSTIAISLRLQSSNGSKSFLNPNARIGDTNAVNEWIHVKVNADDSKLIKPSVYVGFGSKQKSNLYLSALVNDAHYDIKFHHRCVVDGCAAKPQLSKHELQGDMYICSYHRKMVAHDILGKLDSKKCKISDQLVKACKDLATKTDRQLYADSVKMLDKLPKDYFARYYSKIEARLYDISESLSSDKIKKNEASVKELHDEHAQLRQLSKYLLFVRKTINPSVISVYMSLAGIINDIFNQDNILEMMARDGIGTLTSLITDAVSTACKPIEPAADAINQGIFNICARSPNVGPYQSPYESRIRSNTETIELVRQQLLDIGDDENARAINDSNTLLNQVSEEMKSSQDQIASLDTQINGIINSLNQNGNLFNRFRNGNGDINDFMNVLQQQMDETGANIVRAEANRDQQQAILNNNNLNRRAQRRVAGFQRQVVRNTEYLGGLQAMQQLLQVRQAVSREIHNLQMETQRIERERRELERRREQDRIDRERLQREQRRLEEENRAMRERQRIERERHAHVHRNPIHCSVGHSQGWIDLDHNIVTRCKVVKGGFIYKYRVWVDVRTSCYLHITDGEGDTYGLSCIRTGTHYVDYNSSDATIKRIRF